MLIYFWFFLNSLFLNHFLRQCLFYFNFLFLNLLCLILRFLFWHSYIIVDSLNFLNRLFDWNLRILNILLLNVLFLILWNSLDSGLLIVNYFLRNLIRLDNFLFFLNLLNCRLLRLLQIGFLLLISDWLLLLL